MSSVFLSHNSRDKPWVRALAERLTSDGVLVWLDEAELDIGDSLIDKISAGIQDMKYVAAIISTNSIESSWVQKEINLAMTKEITGRKVTVLPLVIEKCTLPASLTDKLYADFTNPDNYEVEYYKLLRALGVGSRSTVTAHQKSVVSNPCVKDTNRNEASIEGIKIVGVVKERTKQDREFSGLQHYYLKLSQRPPRGWSDFFNQARKFPRHSMWREAWTEDDCIVVKCALEELSRYHVNDLKTDVETANASYLHALKCEEQRKVHEKEQQEKERKIRDDALDNLKF